MNSGGGEIIVIFLWLAPAAIGFVLVFKLVSAIERISHAFESASRSLEVIAKAQTRLL